jgi:hypothetical protein
MKLIFQILLLGLMIHSVNGFSQSLEKPEKKEIRIKVENNNPDKTYHVKIVTEKDGTEKVYEKTYGSLEEMESDSAISIRVSGEQHKTFNIKVEKFPEDFNWEEAEDSLDHQVIKTGGGNFVFINEDGDEPSLEFFSEADSGKNQQSYQIKIVKKGNSIEESNEIKKEMLVLKDDEGNVSIHPGSESKEMIWVEKDTGSRHKINVIKSSVNKAHIEDIPATDGDFSDFNIGSMPLLTLKTLNYYPNPNEGEFTLVFSGTKKPLIVRILNQKGNLMYEEELNDFSGYYNEVINVKKFDKGNYLLQIHQQGQVLNKKLILE